MQKKYKWRPTGGSSRDTEHTGMLICCSTPSNSFVLITCSDDSSIGYMLDMYSSFIIQLTDSPVFIR